MTLTAHRYPGGPAGDGDIRSREALYEQASARISRTPSRNIFTYARIVPRRTTQHFDPTAHRLSMSMREHELAPVHAVHAVHAVQLACSWTWHACTGNTHVECKLGSRDS